ncbi:MAG TPA: hypothetical protein VF457_01345 [Burkholderiaceae bacterium]
MKTVVAAAAVTCLTLIAHAQGGAASPAPPGKPAAAESSTVAAAVMPFVGHKLSEAESSEFVKFFHLAPSPNWPANSPDPAYPGRTLTMYGSTGQFGGVATLMLATKSGDDEVIDAGLMVRRNFIDEPGTQMFARDIAKSFLDVSPGAGDPGIRALHHELWECATHVASDCGSPSIPYEVFLGQGAKARIDVADGYVMLQNANVVGAPVLFIEGGRRSP